MKEKLKGKRYRWNAPTLHDLLLLNTEPYWTMYQNRHWMEPNVKLFCTCPNCPFHVVDIIVQNLFFSRKLLLTFVVNSKINNMYKMLIWIELRTRKYYVLWSYYAFKTWKLVNKKINVLVLLLRSIFNMQHYYCSCKEAHVDLF